MDIPAPGPEQALSYGSHLERWCHAQALQYLARHQQRTDREFQSDLCAGDSASRPVFAKVGIVGAGLMGTSIAAWHLRHGCDVALVDVSKTSLHTAPERISRELTCASACRAEDMQALVNAWLSHLVCSPQLTSLFQCECVIEAVPEDLQLKRDVLKQLEAAISRQSLVFSNTSTIPLERLAGAMAGRDRLCGLHFLHPVRERPIVEVIPHRDTSGAVISRVIRHALSVGKLPLLVPDAPGFVVNRLLLPYLNEALQLLLEGCLPQEIDRQAVEIGFAWGPIRVMDEIGLDTTWSAGRIFWEAFPERLAPSPILVTMIKRKRLGRKVGRGFYVYPAGEESLVTEPPATPTMEAEFDPKLLDLLSPWVADPPRTQHLNLGVRLALAMTGEALRLLGEGRLIDSRLADAAAVLGLGFPKALGGPLYWATCLGKNQLKRLIEKTWSHLGPPTELFHVVDKVFSEKFDLLPSEAARLE